MRRETGAGDAKSGVGGTVADRFKRPGHLYGESADDLLPSKGFGPWRRCIYE